MKLNDTVKWTSIDKDGTFSYAGTVRRLEKDYVTISTKKGFVFSVKLNDGTFEVLDHTDTSLDTSDVSVEQDTINDVGAKQIAEPKQGSKLERAMSYLRTNQCSRKEMIAMLMVDLQMSEAGASTYYQLAKKRLASEDNR